MGKCDIKISKGVTINTGNYESIRPSVEITFKDVDVDIINDFYEKADDIVCDLLALGSFSLRAVKKEAIDEATISEETYKEIINSIEKEVKDLSILYNRQDKIS